jgi:RimJ/RimL family protein N-acetyltransferase
MPYGPFSDFDEFEQWRKRLAKNDVLYGILDQRNDRILGYIAYIRVNLEHQSIEIGHVLFSKEIQKTRIASEAVILLIVHAFERVGIKRCEWKCDSLNHGSFKAAERFGFLLEGIFRNHRVVTQRNRDTLWLSILDTEFPNLKKCYDLWLSEENFDSRGQQKLKLSELTENIPDRTQMNVEWKSDSDPLTNSKFGIQVGPFIQKQEILKNYAHMGKRCKLVPIEEIEILEINMTSLYDGSNLSKESFEKTRQKAHLNFGVIDLNSKSLNGLIGFDTVDEKNGSIEIANIYISENSTLVYESVILLLKFAFEKLGFRRCEIKCWKSNEAALNFITSLGFSVEAVFRNHLIFEGISKDSVYASIIESEFEQLSKLWDQWLANPEEIHLKELTKTAKHTNPPKITVDNRLFGYQ